MSLARMILDEANEDIESTELYQLVQQNIPDIISGLDVLAKEFEYAHSDTTVQDTESFGRAYKALDTICKELSKNGFTYFPQPSELSHKVLSGVFRNYKDFYEEYSNGFDSKDIEILNTNSKDLLSVFDRLKAM